MTGTVYDSIFVQDGKFMSFLVGTAAITLGNLVSISTGTSNTVVTAGDSTITLAIGVAIGVRRLNITQTDGVAGVGERITVAMVGSGVVCSVTASGGITRGDLVMAAHDGTVQLHTVTSALYNRYIGRALTSATDETTVKIKLL